MAVNLALAFAEKGLRMAVLDADPITENWLTAYGDELKLILSNNDEMALGAVEATEAAGREDIIIMGVDLIPDAKQAIIDGRLDASVMQDGKVQILSAHLIF